MVKNFLTFGTVFVHRKKATYNPLWKMPCWRLMASVAMFMTFTLIVSTFLWAPIQGIVCAVIIVGTGLPVYHFWNKKNQQKQVS